MVYRNTNSTSEKAKHHKHRASAVTTKGVAEATGISATTVASVLSGRNVVRVSEATRERVLAAAQEMGYRRNGLAAALRTGRTNTIGIVSPLAWSGVADKLRHGYLRDLLVGISVAAARAGMNAMTFLETPLAELAPESVADRRVEGVVLFGMPVDLEGAQEWVDALYATGIACAEIGSRYGRYQVHADNFGGARLATEHLIGLGHRRIGYRQIEDGRRVSAETRAAGFRAAAGAHGLSEAETPVARTRAEFGALLERPDRPTAFFCYNDGLAVQAFDDIHAAGLQIPDDISLVGFDNDQRAGAMRPRLTTVDNPLDALAEAAVALVLAQLRGEEAACASPLIDTHLVLRDSTAPPPP